MFSGHFPAYDPLRQAGRGHSWPSRRFAVEYPTFTFRPTLVLYVSLNVYTICALRVNGSFLESEVGYNVRSAVFPDVPACPSGSYAAKAYH